MHSLADETFWTLFRSVGHWEFELFLTVLFDVVFGFLIWQKLLKPLITKRHAQAISEEHALHGIEDHDHAMHEQMAHDMKLNDGA